MSWKIEVDLVEYHDTWLNIIDIIMMLSQFRWG